MGLSTIMLKFAWFIEYVFSSIGGAFSGAEREDGTRQEVRQQSGAANVTYANTTTIMPASTGDAVLFTSLGIGGGVITILALYMLYTGTKQIMRGTGKIAIALFLLTVSSGTLVLVYSHASGVPSIQMPIQEAVANFTAQNIAG